MGTTSASGTGAPQAAAPHVPVPEVAGRPYSAPPARGPVERIAAAVTARATDGCVLVTLDGRAGAGKSTLAAAVAAYLGGPGHAVVVHGDDFFHPMPCHERLSMEPEEGYHWLFEWQRLRDQVLVPLSDGRPARYEQFDRDANALRAGGPRSVPPADVVIVEGVLTARPELAGFYDLTVFVDTPSELCLRRVHARPDLRPQREAWLTHWRAVEEYYLTATDMPARADLTVPGD
ncbi:uridine kinase [Kitasatospora sp. NPDC101155]|uniref:uridine kinase family protein n=1 Tax=Kitasatospora sp. NPDC101155 TaxID=3364097 RepID=UPI00380E4E91